MLFLKILVNLSVIIESLINFYLKDMYRHWRFIGSDINKWYTGRV